MCELAESKKYSFVRALDCIKVITHAIWMFFTWLKDASKVSVPGCKVQVII